MRRSTRPRALLDQDSAELHERGTVRQKNENVFVFSGLDPSVLYRLAALPDEKSVAFTPDTLLTDPRTGRQTALSQMSARSLDRALDALEGKTVPQKPKPASVDVVLSGETREDVAAAAQRIRPTGGDSQTNENPGDRELAMGGWG